MHRFLTAFLLCFMAYMHTALADARVFFTKMEIHNCDEVGICDWRLSCALGNQQQVEFFSFQEANTNESIPINRILTQSQFPPAVVTCSVWEHDGGIGAEWEVVGTGDLFVQTTGPHLIRLSSSEGEVSVHFSVESVGSTGQPLTISPLVISPVVTFLLN